MGGWCEAEFRRGDDVPATMRCVQGDPTQEKVTWSPYALINKVKNIWCQWPAFGLADVRCVCKNEDKCNNLEKPGRSNRRNSGYRLEAGPLGADCPGQPSQMMSPVTCHLSPVTCHL